MVFLSVAELYTGYRHMLSRSVGDANTVVIFVAPDCDALCAMRILMSLLKSDFIPMEVEPVAGFSDMEAARDRLVEGRPDVRSVFMINCGNVVDLAEFFDGCNSAMFYVVDHHRPFDLNNVYLSKNVVLFDDGYPHDDIPTQENLELLLREGDAEGDDDDEGEEDDEAEGDDMGDDGDLMSKQASADGSEGEGGDEGDDEGNSRRDRDSQDERLSKRQKIKAHQQQSPELRARIRRAQRVINKYYGGASHGSSSASLMYLMATQLGKASNELLWLAIVGLTDMYFHERISSERYEAETVQFRLQVKDRNEDDARIDWAGTLERADDHIACISDFRFSQLRHWSLYESMYYSPFVAARLGIWKDHGRRKLETFLATMGIPLIHAQQNYSSMRTSFKEVLRDQLSEYADSFGLYDLSFPSFSRRVGYAEEVSASDVVHSICALLESQTGDDAKGHDWRDSFWRASSALLSNHVEELKRGLELSIEVQKAIINQGTAMLEKKALVNTGAFRYAYLTEGSRHFFDNSLALIRLAHFLVDIQRQTAKQLKPFVLASLNQANNTYLIVGVCGTEEFGTVIRNDFGKYFRIAATNSRAQVEHDSFDTCSIVVDKNDMPLFMDRLHQELTYAV